MPFIRSESCSFIWHPKGVTWYFIAAQAYPYVGLIPSEQDRAAMRSLTAGGTDGNEQLTAATGVLLIALLAVLGVTIVLIGQLIAVHLFLGLLLIGPVLLKMASTGYRFVRYYTQNPPYREKG